MTEPIASQPDGTAAETSIITSTPSPAANSQADAEPEAPVTLKQAAAEFHCAASSLKNNIKSNKLTAVQENPKAAYLVRLSDVAAFLSATPGIVSRFHPKPEGAPIHSVPESSPPVSSREPQATANASLVRHDVPQAPLPAMSVARSGEAPLSATPKHEAVPPDLLAKGDKRRRHRRRGKGGGTARTTGTGNPQLLIKNLSGASPQERLRVVAVLNELAGIIASS